MIDQMVNACDTGLKVWIGILLLTATSYLQRMHALKVHLLAISDLLLHACC